MTARVAAIAMALAGTTVLPALAQDRGMTITVEEMNEQGERWII